MRDIRPVRRKPEEEPATELYEASEAPKLSAKRERSEAETRKLVPVSSIDVPKVPPAPARLAAQPPKVGSGERKMLLLAFALLIVAGAIAAFIFLPTATIALRLRTAPLLVDEEITLGQGSSVAGQAFVREVSVNGVVPVEHTEVVGAKATGQAVIVNASSSEQPIRERSRLVTSDGKLFYLLRHAIVPPSSQVTVDIEAAEAGEEYNITAQRLDFAALEPSARQVVYAQVSSMLTGGSGEVISVVSEEDLSAAQRNAGEVAKAQVESEIRSALSEGWTLVEESWTGEVAAFTPTANAGDKTPEIAYTASVVVRVMGFEQEKLLSHLRDILGRQLTDEFMLFPGPISYTKSVQAVDWDKGEITLAVRVTHTTIPNLKLDTLKEKLAGRSADEARNYLDGLQGVESAEISLWPVWVHTIPRIEKRISLELRPERGP